jgi:hypothetical protein
LIFSDRFQTGFMPALLIDTEFLKLTLGMFCLAAALVTWHWRRGVAARRLAKGLRSYTMGVQGAS